MKTFKKTKTNSRHSSTRVHGYPSLYMHHSKHKKYWKCTNPVHNVLAAKRMLKQQETSKQSR